MGFRRLLILLPKHSYFHVERALGLSNDDSSFRRKVESKLELNLIRPRLTQQIQYGLSSVADGRQHAAERLRKLPHHVSDSSYLDGALSLSRRLEQNFAAAFERYPH
ncbi:hypothetical protein SUDANB105_05229 [Streptomyces sp. enrichment culture]